MVVGTLYEYQVIPMATFESFLPLSINQLAAAVRIFIISSFVRLQCEQLYMDIYAVPWHRLPVHLQKIFVIVLQNAQSPNLMTIGDLAPLNLASELSVSRLKSQMKAFDGSVKSPI